MHPVERRLLTASNALVGLTGLGYAAVRYLLTPEDPFAASHPAEPFWRDAHIVSAPLLALAIGHFAWHHGVAYWRDGAREGRASGAIMLGTALPMIVSGALIQTAKEDAWRLAWVAVHLVTSAMWLAACATHIIIHRRARRAGRPLPTKSETTASPEKIGAPGAQPVRSN